MCSAGIFPECDFHGNSLQNVFDLKKTNDVITFSSIAINNGGAVIFCWIEDKNNKSKCREFIESLSKIESNIVTNSLIRFFFEFSENVFIEPTWWESLDQKKKEYLQKRYTSGINSIRSVNCLMNDDMFFDDWVVEKRQIIE